MLPEISKLEFENEVENTEETTDNTFSFDFEKGEFALIDGKVIPLQGVEYIKAWIEKTVRTRKNLEIYLEYGSSHHEMIGGVFDRDFARAEITRMIKDALLKNEKILSVESIEISIEGSKTNLTLQVETSYGSAEVSL